MARILGDPFDEYVHKQINVRQKSLAKSQKSDDDIKVFNTSTPWIRLSSSIEVSTKRAEKLAINLGVSTADIVGSALAKKLVLFAGTTDSTGGTQRGGVGYGFNNAYGFLSDPDQGYKPMPGISSISTTYKSNGSLKQAQVKLKCYTRKQFEALEAIYLRLGYTMILEYGHSVYFTNAGIKENMSSLQVPNVLFHHVKVDPEKMAQNAAAQVTGDQTAKDVAYDEAKQEAEALAREKFGARKIRLIFEENKKSTGGNYDALLAKVANFSWSLGNDLSYDITLDLISVGDIIDSLKMNIGGGGETVDSYEVEGSPGIQNLVNIRLQRSTGRFITFLQELTKILGDPAVLATTSEATQAKTADVDKFVNLFAIVSGYKQTYLDSITAIESKITAPYDTVREWLLTQDVEIRTAPFSNIASLGTGDFNTVLLVNPIPDNIRAAIDAAELTGLFNTTNDLNKDIPNTEGYFEYRQTILEYYGIDYKNLGIVPETENPNTPSKSDTGKLVPKDTYTSKAYSKLKKDLQDIRKAVSEKPNITPKEAEDSLNNESQIEAFSQYGDRPLEAIKYLIGSKTATDIEGLKDLKDSLSKNGNTGKEYTFLIQTKIK